MFRTKSLLIIRRYYSVYTAIGIVNITHDYTNCFLYRVDLPDDEQHVCSKHVEAFYLNKLIENGASCWFLLYGYNTMHSQQNIRKGQVV